MKNITKTIIGTMAVALCASSASAAVIVSDDFEYADLAAMQANWGTTAGMSLTNATGNATQAGAHSGAATIHQWIGSSFSLTPTDENPVVLASDIWYSGSNNQRNTIGLRNGANPLFELGFYNQLGANGLAFRVLSFAGNEGWKEILPYGTLGTSEQWIHVEATFTADSVSISYDLGNDSSIDGTVSSSGSGFANPFVDLRFGGPSGASSGGGGFAIDNLTLSVVPVPEPSTIALGLLGGAGLMAGYLRSRKK